MRHAKGEAGRIASNPKALNAGKVGDFLGFGDFRGATPKL
jgi:hypothetical protein